MNLKNFSDFLKESKLVKESYVKGVNFIDEVEFLDASSKMLEMLSDYANSFDSLVDVSVVDNRRSGGSYVLEFSITIPKYGIWYSGDSLGSRELGKYADIYMEEFDSEMKRYRHVSREKSEFYVTFSADFSDTNASLEFSVSADSYNRSKKVFEKVSEKLKDSSDVSKLDFLEKHIPKILKKYKM
jgi:hypothetical protein